MDTITLVYVSTNEREVHPAIHTLKAFALGRMKKDAPRIMTVTFRFPPVPSNRRNPLSEAELSGAVKKILAGKPKMVGFSLYVWNVDVSLQIIAGLKKTDPGLNVIIGGAEASSHGEALLRRHSHIDIVAVDEAEETLVELIESVLKGKVPLGSVAGILYRQDGRIMHTARRQPVDLAAVPSPYTVPAAGVRIRKNDTYAVETSRGCPYRCAYCSYNIRTYATLRYFPLAKVREELSFLLRKQVKAINIIDDNFNINEERARTILRIIRRHNVCTTVTLFVRADVWPIGKKTAEQLSHPLFHLDVGVQSLNPDTLKTARRTATRSVLEANLLQFDKYKARYTLQFIIGLPGDREADIKEDINWAMGFSPESIHLQVLRINPETLFEREASSLGLHYAKNPPYTITRSATMSPAVLRRLRLLSAAVRLVYRDKAFRKEFYRLHDKLGQPYATVLERMLRGESFLARLMG